MPTVYAYSTWPKGSPSLLGAAGDGDANAWFYRKDWFSSAEIQAEFKEKTGRDLTVADLAGTARNGRVLPGQGDADGKKGLWRGDLHRARFEGITMGATQAL